MNKEALYHRPKNNYAYAYDVDTLHIRLQSKKGDLESVKLIYGDPYRWAEDAMLSDKIPMHISGSDELFDYWFIAIKPENKRFVYMFEVSDGTECHVHGEKGFTPDEKENRFFRFPYLNAIDVFDAPAWVKDTVWYQIFPERFANGNPGRKNNVTDTWGDDPKPDSFFGGDLEGITEHIDYLVDLGITGIYLNPIFESPTNHKYDTTNYMEIDPQFGDKQTFKQFVDVCHERGIRVMLDGVFNHCGYQFAPFQDVLKRGAESPYADWFHIYEHAVEEGELPSYETFAFVPEMPKLNTSHPEVKQYLLDVAKYWIEEFHIDGWRMDVGNEIDHKFWREFRQTVRSVNDELYIIAEIWNDAMPWLQGDQMDSVMNYPFTESAIDFTAKNKIGARDFGNQIVKHLHLYPENVNEVMFNLLGSHDTARILTLCGEDTEKLKLTYLLLLTYPGSPCIFYGDEIGLTGDGDNFAYYRKCMVWEKEHQDTDLLTFIQRLIQLRKTLKPLTADAQYSIIEADNTTNHLVFSRTYGNEKIVVALNNGEEDTTIVLSDHIVGKTPTNAWTNESLLLESDNLHITLLPKQFIFIHTVL
ncbi:glycosidase [Paenibacillus anaericanus]|uniref:alpha-glycosidase n=1 Tax=Paenibacillus anaericanus TaxID=170367 RepID=UPI0027852994|nr:alpha-glycosidase [Paenibacillus anaericanus]MDQ0091315.1 glycosidase [Paenibacillus anaericanus]